MDNSIKQYAIGELLDGRYFYIPSYQRGYRWTEKQVGDLLRDLLCFANDFANEGKEQDQFYCLQPVIARPITDEDKLKSMFGTEYKEGILSHGVWEIIDGQQRHNYISTIQVPSRSKRMECGNLERRGRW